MKVNIKLGRPLIHLALVLVVMGLLQVAFGLNTATAATNVIKYSDSADLSGAIDLKDKDIDKDVYVFTEDSGDLGGEVVWGTSVWWGSVSPVDTGVFTFGDSFLLSNAGDAGENVVKYMPTNESQPPEVAHYNVTYGADYAVEPNPGFNVKYYERGSTRYILAGTTGVPGGGDEKWRFVHKNFDQGDVNEKTLTGIGSIVNGDPVTNPTSQTLKDVVQLSVEDRVLAAGSYVENNLGPVRPVVASLGYLTPSEVGRMWKSTNVWGVDVPGSVNSIVVGLDNAHGDDLVSSAYNLDRHAWIAGYRDDGSGDKWAINKIDTKTGNSAGPGETSVAGRANAIVKDSDYIYVGGYVENGDDYWRIEKRKRDDLSLVNYIEPLKTGTSAGVKGQILALNVEFNQGTVAVWAAGYEKNGADKWLFKKFTFNSGNFVDSGIEGPAGTVNGAIKSINIGGAENIYFGGIEDSGALIQRYSLSGSPGVDAYTDSNNMFSDMNLPNVVLKTPSPSPALGFVKGVKVYKKPVACVVPSVPGTVSGSRVVLDHEVFRGLYTKDGSDMTDPVDRYSAVGVPLSVPASEPNIPKGKYAVTQVTSEIGHTDMSVHDEQTQDHEQFVTYFFGAGFTGTDNEAGFAKTGASEDVDNDAIWSSKQQDLTIKFEVDKFTVAHYAYENANSSVSEPLNRAPGGTLSYNKDNWRDQGSVEALCTVLDRYPECNDGIDNDGDTLIDYPADPGCDSINDDDETDGGPGTVCTLDPADYDYVVPIMAGMIDPINTLISFKLNAPHPVWPPYTDSPIAKNIPAGFYEVTLESEDGYVGRASELPHQDNESWQVVLYDSADNVVATSKPSPDLLESEFTQEVEIVNSMSDLLEVSVDVTGIRAVHPAPIGNNSVQAVCAGFRLPECSNGIDDDGDTLIDNLLGQEDPGCYTDEDTTVPGNYNPDDNDESNRPNIIEPIFGTIDLSPGWTLSTGFYDYVDMSYTLKNDGSAGTGAFNNKIDSYFSTNSQTPVDIPTYNQERDNLAFSNLTANGGHRTVVQNIGNDVPPGNFEVTIEADVPLHPGVVDESDEDDNTKTKINYPYIPAPDPGVDIWADDKFVRAGETTKLRWNTKASYSMDCNISGPNMTTYNFNPGPDAPGTQTGEIETGVINYKSVFTLKCDELISGYGDPLTPDNATVEVIGEPEEN